MIQYKYGKEMRRMQTYICVHCGEEFTGKKRKYCNDKCRYEYNKVRKIKQYRLDNNIKKGRD